jgi:hypothetical protein
MYEYNGYILEVYNDATIKCSIKLGFGVFSIQRVRFSNIIITACDTYCLNKIKDLLLQKEIIIKTFKEDTPGSDTLYKADIFIETKVGIVCVNDWLVSKKMAQYINEI